MASEFFIKDLDLIQEQNDVIYRLAKDLARRRAFQLDKDLLDLINKGSVLLNLKVGQEIRSKGVFWQNVKITPMTQTINKLINEKTERKVVDCFWPFSISC